MKSCRVGRLGRRKELLRFRLRRQAKKVMIKMLIKPRRKTRSDGDASIISSGKFCFPLSYMFTGMGCLNILSTSFHIRGSYGSLGTFILNCFWCFQSCSYMITGWILLVFYSGPFFWLIDGLMMLIDEYIVSDSPASSLG
jgi:hypothetical protein